MSMMPCVEVPRSRTRVMKADLLTSHMSNRQEEVPSLRTDHKGIVGACVPCAKVASAYLRLSAPRCRTSSLIPPISRW